MKKDLIKAISNLENEKEVENFLNDLLTPAEMDELSTRFQIAKLLWTTDMPYLEIANKLKTSTTTVTRVARFLHKEPNKGYKKILKRVFPQS